MYDLTVLVIGPAFDRDAFGAEVAEWTARSLPDVKTVVVQHLEAECSPRVVFVGDVFGEVPVGHPLALAMAVAS
jgi:hypothetical protein